VTSLDILFRTHGLYLNDVRRTSVHGGSLRLFVEPRENVQESVKLLLRTERERRVDVIDFYREFAGRMEKELVGQGRARRTMAETLEAGWKLLESMPREDLRRIGEAAWRARQEAAR